MSYPQKKESVPIRCDQCEKLLPPILIKYGQDQYLCPLCEMDQKKFFGRSLDEQIKKIGRTSLSPELLD